MFTGMFNVTKSSCPYENWTSVARASCDNPEHFHCLKDEYGRIGWVCVEPIWVEKDRCPTYNVVAQKLDSIDCPKGRCPPYNYRSNEVNVEYSCRYTLDIVSSTTTATDSTNAFFSPSRGNSLLPVFITTSFLILVLILVASVLYLRRRKLSQRSEGHPLESLELINEDSEKSAKETIFSLEKAKHYLEEKNRVVITGVQGTGKTYLAESLVSDLEKKKKKLKKMWVSSSSLLVTEQSKPTRNVDLYILDDIFYELQLESHVHQIVTVLNDLMTKFPEICIIITMPSYIWRKHITLFSKAGLDDVQIDLNERNDSEKRYIIKQLMSKHIIHPTKASRLSKSENIILGKTPFKTIGFPAVISWICKRPHEEAVERMMINSLKKMTEEIEELKQSHRINECAKYVILSYITFNDGFLDISNVDTPLILSVKEMFARGFQEEDLKQYVKDMVGEYLKETKEGVYKLNLNIWSKLVFVSVAKENLRFAEENYKNSRRHIINEKDCPEDMDEAYPECFIKVNRAEKLSLIGEEPL
ncbi:uncharacterized protein LOC111106976 [Crassostrea virginica]